ncbi:PAS domain S-box protein, partial [Candidatus Bathyarchaeota archaeon]|nr:PAS domain S-box protein [Candidatus Bathyarchaeota archaeon]
MEKTELSNEMLSILFEKAPDVIFLYDQNGNFIDGNKDAEKLTGYKIEELIGKNFLNIDLLVPEDIPRAAKNLRRSLKNERTGPAEYKINRKDGTTAHIEIRTYPFTLDGQKIVMGIARDISERKNVQQKLEKTQKDYKKLIDKASDSVVVTRKGKVLYANDAIAQLVGFDHAEEVIGLHLNSFYHPDYNNQVNEYTQARRRGEYAPSRYQMKIVNRAGESIDVDVQ